MEQLPIAQGLTITAEIGKYFLQNLNRTSNAIRFGL